MKRKMAIGAVVLGLGAGGVTVAMPHIPGTGANDRRIARQLVSEQLNDPPSAQFRNVRSTKTVVCGEVNGRNGFGAYAGFRRFLYEPSSGWGMIDPATRYTEQDMEREGESCSPQNRYACDREIEIIKERAKQGGFEKAWKSGCAA